MSRLLLDSVETGTGRTYPRDRRVEGSPFKCRVGRSLYVLLWSHKPAVQIRGIRHPKRVRAPKKSGEGTVAAIGQSLIHHRSRPTTCSRNLFIGCTTRSASQAPNRRFSCVALVLNTPAYRRAFLIASACASYNTVHRVVGLSKASHTSAPATESWGKTTLFLDNGGSPA